MKVVTSIICAFAIASLLCCSMRGQSPDAPAVGYLGNGELEKAARKGANTLAAPPQPDLGPAAFEQWVASACDEVDPAKEPSAITDPILERLKGAGFATDKAVMYGIGAWTAYEGRLAKHDPTKIAKKYEKTVAMIDKICAMLYGREWLKAQLKIRQAELYGLAKRNVEAIAARREAMSELDALHDGMSIDRIGNLTALGDLLYAEGKRKDADKIFLEALDYPWYNTKSWEARSALREKYISAGNGLINCREGNLEALQSLMFAPATLQKLGPNLDQALIDAGGKPRDDWHDITDSLSPQSNDEVKP